MKERGEVRKMETRQRQAWYGGGGGGRQGIEFEIQDMPSIETMRTSDEGGRRLHGEERKRRWWGSC